MGPNGVAAVAAIVATTISADRPRRFPAHEVVPEGERGQDRREHEASVDVRPHHRQDGHEPRPSVSPGEQQPRAREQGHRQRLGPRAQRARADQESEDREDGRGTHVASRAPTAR